MNWWLVGMVFMFITFWAAIATLCHTVAQIPM